MFCFFEPPVSGEMQGQQRQRPTWRTSCNSHKVNTGMQARIHSWDIYLVAIAMIPITGNDATLSLCETEWKCCRIQEASYARAGRSWMVNIQEQETVRIMERGNKEPSNHLLSRGVSGDLQCHATQRRRRCWWLQFDRDGGAGRRRHCGGGGGICNRSRR